MLEVGFYGWCRIVGFLGGDLSVRYPLWLRRLYILTWPVAVIVRGVLFGIFFFGGFFLIFTIGGACEAVMRLRDFFDYLRQQWHYQETK